MTDLLLQVGLSNLAVSLGIAAVAWGVHASGKRPMIAHLLWLIVLVKLVTPPLFSLPVVSLPQWHGAAVVDASAVEPATAEFTLPALPPTNVPATRATDWAGIAPPTTTESAPLAAPASEPWFRWAVVKRLLVACWLVGSLVVMVYTLARVVRFNRLLKTATLPAGPKVQRVAEQAGRRLGLRHVPTVYATPARLSPMVWWVGGAVRVVLPEMLVNECVPTPGRLRWALAHELAHVRRRDHWVRWVEWLACVAFWWNPIAWWARHNLRASEEACCDALVLEHFSKNNDTRTSYADAILSVVESLAQPALRPPAIASEINSGGTLQRRFDMILSSKTTSKAPRWARTAVLLAAVGLMPLGVAQASDTLTKPQGRDGQAQREMEEKADALLADIRAAVEAGDITPEEGERKAAEVRGWLVEDAEGNTWIQYVDPNDEDAMDPGDVDIEHYFLALGVDEAQYDIILDALAERGVGRLQMDATLGGLFHTVLGIHELGAEAMLDRLDENEFFSGHIGLDDAQIELVWALAQRLAAMTAEQEHTEQDAEHDGEIDIRGYFLRLGLTEAGLERVVHALAEHGVGRVQMEPALGGLFHTVLAIREQGVEHALRNIDEGEFFSAHVGLSDDQIEVVAGLARHIAELEPREAGRERDQATADERRGRDRERLQRAEEAQRAAHERERAQREEIRQREREERRQRRERERDRDDDRAESEADYDEAHEAYIDAALDHLKRAIEAGEVSEEQARDRMAEFRRHLIGQVEEALEAGEITRDQASEKVEAIHALTAMPESEAGRR